MGRVQHRRQGLGKTAIGISTDVALGGPGNEAEQNREQYGKDGEAGAGASHERLGVGGSQGMATGVSWLLIIHGLTRGTIRNPSDRRSLDARGCAAISPSPAAGRRRSLRSTR